MFTNTPVLISEVKKAELITDLCRDIDTAEATEVLEELFFTWIGSEDADDTDAETRARVAYHFRTITKFLTKLKDIDSSIYLIPNLS